MRTEADAAAYTDTKQALFPENQGKLPLMQADSLRLGFGAGYAVFTYV